MEVNKGEAERCRDIGATAMKNGDYPKAIKLFEKSLRLYPLPGVQALLSQVERMQQQKQQQSASSSSRPPPAAASATRASSTASSNGSNNNNNNTGADGRSYTEEQVRIVQQVLRAKEGGRGAHYRVLSLQTSCSESEIKKAYRKISLKVHPDKNSAPHSEEAFKAVGLAYATLSDPQKRTIYDRYGEEDPDNRGGGMGGMRPAGGRGVHMNGQDVSPEEIFNMFFGGMQGMNGGGGPGGFHVYSSGFGPGMQFRAGAPPRRRRQPGTQGQEQQQQHQEANPLAMLFQLLPMLLIMLISFMRFHDGDGVSHVSPMPGEYKYFSLTQKAPFVNPMATKLTTVKDIPYFVTDSFLRTYNLERYQLGNVERLVEQAYENYLINQCTSQRNYKKGLERKARLEKVESEKLRKTKQAADFELTRCVELVDLFPKHASAQTKNRNR